MTAAERAVRVIADSGTAMSGFVGLDPRDAVAALMADPDLLRELTDEAEAARPEQPPVLWLWRENGGHR